MVNLLPFLLMTSEVCDLVSALMETSFLVFQKAVQPGGLAGLLAAECVDRLVAVAPCQPGGDVPVIRGLLGLGPLETGRHREYKIFLQRWWGVSGKLQRPA